MDNQSLRVAGLKHDSIVDGKGFRYVIFSQGCKHFCKNCHNPKTHALDAGRLVSTDAIKADIQKNPLLQGITLSGGEPFLQIEPLIDITTWAKSRGLDVWAFSGFTYEELLADENMSKLLGLCDVLVDGRYVDELQTLDTAWVGSSNQRVIDVNQSLTSGSVVLL